MFVASLFSCLWLREQWVSSPCSGSWLGASHLPQVACLLFVGVWDPWVGTAQEQ